MKKYITPSSISNRNLGCSRSAKPVTEYDMEKSGSSGVVKLTKATSEEIEIDSNPEIPECIKIYDLILKNLIYFE